MPFSFQGTRSEDVAVDPHMKDFFQSQNEDIDIQGKPNKPTQPQPLDFEAMHVVLEYCWHRFAG